MAYLKQLRLVLWKNCLIRKRHWLLTLFEILLPILLFILVSYSRSKISGIAKEEILNPTYSEPIKLSEKGEILYTVLDISSTRFFYAPSNNFTDELIRRLQVKLQLYSNDIYSFSSKEELVEEFSKASQTSVAIIFNSDNVKKLDYDLRFYNQYVRGETDDLYLSELQYSNYGLSSYFQSGFMTIQTAVDLVYIEMLKGKEVDIYLTMQEFPYPPYRSDEGLIHIFMPFLSYITIFSFIFLCPALIMRIVEEKSTGTRELLKMVGLKSWMLWLGWFLHAFLPNFVSVLLIVVLMKVPLWGIDTPPIEYCNTAVFFIFLFLYLIASITFCFAISSVFSRPFFGVVVGIVAWILEYTVPENLVTNIQTYKGLKVLLALFPNMCLSYGYKTMTVYEAREIGVNWSNLFEPGSETSDEITMGTVWIMFIVDIIVYMLITLYVSNVFPGPYGIPRPWNFPMEYFGTMCNNKVTNGDGTEPLDDSDSQSENGIEIKNLRKTFGTTVAVNKLSMNIKKNQITVLLGHNGAGKTTTMSMITGMINYTKGRIKVYDHDIKTEEKQVRKLMGLCPQHNLLFNDLTVYEHLILIGGLKEASIEKVKREADDLLQLLKLERKKHRMVSCLSGGMKRKLCLAMAVIGRSQVLILDEPTAGMDPESQREVWSLLLKWRGSKTILISTHYMDEADALADWIAIMANGEKQCFGTPMELKERFKTGYHLSLMLLNTEKLDEISSTILDVIPTAKLKEQHGNNAVYILPIEEKHNFPKLLSILEMRKNEFNLNNISINITTLEDVFLSSRKELDPSIENGGYTKDDLNLPTIEPSTFLPLLLKRLYFLYEKPLSYIIPVILTLLLTLLTIYLGQTPTDSTQQNSLNLHMNLGIYGTTEVFYSLHFEPNYNQTLGTLAKEVGSFYKNEANSEKSYTLEVNSTSDGIIQRGIKNLPFYKNHMVVAAEFNVSENFIRVNAMYSHFAVHGPPISLNLVFNAILKAEMGEEYSIRTSNEPLNTVKRKEATEKSEVQVGLLWLILFPLGLAFLMACFIIFPHMELSTGFIQLQIMCGASSFKYWLSNFIFDFGLYMISAVFIVIITWSSAIMFDWRDFVDAMSPLLVILVFYGLASIPFTYLFTRLKSASSGYAVLLIVSLLSGGTLTLIVNALEQSKDQYYAQIGSVLHMIFLVLFPQYGISYVSVNYSRKVVQNYNWYAMSSQKRRALCKKPDSNPCCFGESSSECLIYKDYFQNEELGIWKDLWKMIFPSILYFIINVLFNSDYFKIVTEEINKLIYHRTSSEESFGNKDVLYTHNLTKYIGGEKVVKGVRFEVDRGKCYGLLGVNGAGKTTTFRMLTKEIIKSDGKSAVFKDEGNVEDKSRTYLQQIGYCPQNNSLNFALTARQLLKIFAYFRGYPFKDLDNVANHFLKMMQLESLADKPCGVYSGGNKRKLCLALALMGYPPNIFLDEPTNGVDPVSRRIFWNIIKEMQTKKKLTFLLTSHSMQECEALCSKLGIMKDGQLECNDTIPQLKEKYHTGFTVKLKLKQQNPPKNHKHLDQLIIRAERKGRKISVEDFPDSIVMQTYSEDKPEDLMNKDNWKNEESSGDSIDSLEYVKNVLENEYDGELKDEHPGLLHYHVNQMQSSKKTMSKLFEDMEELKNKCSIIEDYIVTETTVEDVFLTVAKADSSSGSSNKTSSNSSEKSSKSSSKKNSKSSSETSSKSYIV